MPEEGDGDVQQDPRPGQDQARAPGQAAQGVRARYLLRPVDQPIRRRSLKQFKHLYEGPVGPLPHPVSFSIYNIALGFTV